ncbi:M15 family metallopeptidase [Psychroserpens sp. MEBiC05023]
MECSNILEAAVKKGNISQSLFKGSTKTELIIDLQRTLFELGFRKELKWDNYQADGNYGKATAAAVASFAKKNKIHSDGTVVSTKLAKLILQRHDFLPDMYTLWTIYKSDLRTRKYISRGTRMSIRAVQVLLYEIGYETQLKFHKFGADGLYGNNTKNAIIAYANDNGIDSDGDLLTRPFVNLMIKDINTFYGRYWSELAEKNLPDKSSPLILFTGSQFMGKPCRADIEFAPILDKINRHAVDANISVYITSSFRTTTNVNGAIVEPAIFSNHLAGHGIDMNVIYDNNKWANSKVLKKYPNIPDPVRRFIKAIIDDPDLRWGGTFQTKDPVHIDDGLNRNMNQWKKRYKAMQQAVQLGH